MPLAMKSPKDQYLVHMELPEEDEEPLQDVDLINGDLYEFLTPIFQSQLRRLFEIEEIIKKRN